MKPLAKIISFPNKKTDSVKKTRAKITDVLIDRLEKNEDHIKIGEVNFTCPDCKSTASFDFTNLIFKAVTFFCGNCGHGYTISNPVFQKTNNTIDKKRIDK